MTTNKYPDKTVYLAGPITGLTYQDARFGWRQEFAGYLPPHIHPMSPIRFKDYLSGEESLAGDPDMYPAHLLSRPKGIVCRDHNDLRTADAMVACFLGANKASIGTCIEFGWAHAYDIPLVMVIEDEGKIAQPDLVHPRELQTMVDNPHWHAMLTEIAGYVTPSLEEAAKVVEYLLTPGI